jgi:hypothetical protein
MSASGASRSRSRSSLMHVFKTVVGCTSRSLSVGICAAYAAIVGLVEMQSSDVHDEIK